MSYSDNIRIITETLELCQSTPILADAISASRERQTTVLESETVPAAKARYEEDAQIVVSPRRTFQAASAYAGQKVAVLNFASAVSPGGGVLTGCNAQEESLCRISTLHPCLDVPENRNRFYHPHRQANQRLNNDDCIYTPGVVVFRSDDSAEAVLPEEEWFRTDVITCAAPDLRTFRPGTVPDETIDRLHRHRLRRILDVAYANGAEVVILGAFGCGAFGNDPAVVAKAMADVVREYRRMFRTIEFAIYCSPAHMQNFVEFRSAMAQL